MRSRLFPARSTPRPSATLWPASRINLTALLLLAYSGMVVARVQRRTRDAAIRLSTVDSLTDLYNRAFFFNAVEHEIQRSRRFRRGFCLLMMDLDGLKTINDRYGHYEGDVILRGVARAHPVRLRGIDVAARYGGDEFVALLPETDPSGAYVVAEKIRQMASELVVETGGQQITTSLSIGVVSYPDDGQTADELMIAADEAMYSSKRTGQEPCRRVRARRRARRARRAATYVLSIARLRRRASGPSRAKTTAGGSRAASAEVGPARSAPDRRPGTSSSCLRSSGLPTAGRRIR